MKANRFLEKLTTDLPAKIFCFIIALFLCLFYQLSLVEKKTIVIPLNVIQDGDVVRVSDVPSSIKVVVRTSSDEANLVHADGIQATLNLNYLSGNGTYDVPVFLDVNKDLLVLDPLELKAKPEFVSVKVEKKIKKAVRVETPFIGEVAHGYAVSEVSVTPDIVYVTGPESVVNGKSVLYTDTVDLQDIDTGNQFEVHLQKPDKLLSYDEEEYYETSVSINPIEIEKTFENIQLTAINLNNDYLLENDLPLINFKLSGWMLILENYNLPEKCVTVDLSQITEEGNYTLPVSVNIPQTLILSDKSFDTVDVKIIKKPVEEEGVVPNL